MKEQDTFFKIVGSGLRVLAGGIYAVAEKIDTLASDQKEAQKTAAPRPGPGPHSEETGPGTPIRVKPEPREKKQTRTSTYAVMSVIDAGEGPIDVDQLTAETGFERRKIHNTLYRLKKQGRIRSVGKGAYTKC